MMLPENELPLFERPAAATATHFQNSSISVCIFVYPIIPSVLLWFIYIVSSPGYKDNS